MSKSPEEIRAEIEDTRARMGDRVDALGYKADVPSRGREYVAERRDRLASRIRGVTPDGGQVAGGARRTAAAARENPLGVAVGAAAAGFLTGLVLPSSRVEDERVGELADEVKQRARDVGEEALERGKQVAQEAGAAAMATAKEQGRSQADELSASAETEIREARRA